MRVKGKKLSAVLSKLKHKSNTKILLLIINIHFQMILLCCSCRQYLLSLSPIVVNEIDDKTKRLSQSNAILEGEIQNVVQVFTSITDAAINVSCTASRSFHSA